MLDFLLTNQGFVLAVAGGIAGAALYHLLPVVLRVVWFLARLASWFPWMMLGFFGFLFRIHDMGPREWREILIPSRKPKKQDSLPEYERDTRALVDTLRGGVAELNARVDANWDVVAIDIQSSAKRIKTIEDRVAALEYLDSNDPDFTQEPGVPYGKAVARPYDDNYAWTKICDPDACHVLARFPVVRAWNAPGGIRYLWDGSAMWSRVDSKWQEDDLDVDTLEGAAQCCPKTDGELSGHEALDLYRDLQRFQGKAHQTATGDMIANEQFRMESLARFNQAIRTA